MAVFDRLQSAVHKGFNKVAETRVADSDPDLALYEKMTPEALSVIADTYGQDKLLEYVQTMEARRMKKMTRGEM